MFPTIHFYRRCQHESYAEAKAAGAIRYHRLEGYGMHFESFAQGEPADAMELILLAANMMEHQPAISFFLIGTKGELLDHVTRNLFQH